MERFRIPAQRHLSWLLKSLFKVSEDSDLIHNSDDNVLMSAELVSLKLHEFCYFLLYHFFLLLVIRLSQQITQF